MEKPSPKFVQKLEESLRLKYRAEFSRQNSEVKSSFKFLKFFIPVFSGALILTLVFMNFNFNSGTNNLTQFPNQSTGGQNSDGNNQFEAFNEGAEEEQVLQDFDNDELNQIDNGVKLAAAGNFQ